MVSEPRRPARSKNVLAQIDPAFIAVCARRSNGEGQRPPVNQSCGGGSPAHNKDVGQEDGSRHPRFEKTVPDTQEDGSGHPRFARRRFQTPKKTVPDTHASREDGSRHPRSEGRRFQTPKKTVPDTHASREDGSRHPRRRFRTPTLRGKTVPDTHAPSDWWQLEFPSPNGGCPATLPPNGGCPATLPWLSGSPLFSGFPLGEEI
jgi:hypothetical protein